MNYVAVFGTLKNCQQANDKVGGMDAPFLLGETIQTYSMTDVGFPYIQRDIGGCPVLVHVYAVDEDMLNDLDNYEGVPHHYTRESCDVWIPSLLDTIHNVFIYEAVTLVGTPVNEVEGVLCWNTSTLAQEEEVLEYYQAGDVADYSLEDLGLPRIESSESILSSTFDKITVGCSPFIHRIKNYKRVYEYGEVY